jgi:hypothetical protein
MDGRGISNAPKAAAQLARSIGNSGITERMGHRLSVEVYVHYYGGEDEQEEPETRLLQSAQSQAAIR